jgi:hypothetical protein
MLAQEAGDFLTAWSLARATSRICLELQLHKAGKVFANPGAELEAYYCFTICYMNDKGLAMNLGLPSFIPNSSMEVDILAHPRSPIAIDNFYLYLNLARIQSFIIEDLKSAANTDQMQQAVDNILAKMDSIGRLKVSMELCPCDGERNFLSSQQILTSFR